MSPGMASAAGGDRVEATARHEGLARAVGGWVVRHHRLCFVLVLALVAGNVFLDLGNSKVNDYDEARYGVSAFEMQQHQDFVVPTYAGRKELWALKPPLGYWLMALSFALFGGSALAMRLPSALCAVAAAAVTMSFARRWFHRRLAILAGLIVATTFGYLSHHGARSGDFDSALTLILLLAAVQLPGLGVSPWRVVPLAAVFACGFLLKSFGIVPMLAVTGAYLLWSGDWRRQRPLPWLAAAGVFAAIVGGWAAARWHADGSPDFLLRMLREDVVDRSTSIVDRSTSSPYGYLLALFDRFAPWPPLMLAAAAVVLRVRRPQWLQHLRRGRIAGLLALWVALPLTIVSLVRTQHHWYLDPIYPALAMVAAGSALFLIKRMPERLRGPAVIGLLVLPLTLCEARLVGHVLLRDPMPASQRFLRALKPAEATDCHAIRSTFALAYSERFILEVVDGFRVVEPAAGGRDRGAPAADGTCLLVGKSAWRRPAAAVDPVPRGEVLLADSASYAVYRPAGGPAVSR
jgi:4-amino-4-deoxy-L-arabinose transferase-like glycosyltransferase